VDGLNNRCNIRFSAEFFDGEGFGSQLIVKDLLDILGREVGGDKPLPCAFAGGILSGPSVSTSTITGLTGYPQSENICGFEMMIECILNIQLTLLVLLYSSFSFAYSNCICTG
jgi:hypothetical protein